MPLQPAVYMLANYKAGILYVGVTSNLPRRIEEHKQDRIPGFTNLFQTHLLVWYECLERMEEAIRREKRLKKWKREWKIHLIEKTNPEWKDLAEDLMTL